MTWLHTADDTSIMLAAPCKLAYHAQRYRRVYVVQKRKAFSRLHISFHRRLRLAVGALNNTELYLCCPLPPSLFGPCLFLYPCDASFPEQFVYCMMVGSFPFNSFLAGFMCSVGCFVLTGTGVGVALCMPLYIEYIFFSVVLRVSWRKQGYPAGSCAL